MIATVASAHPVPSGRCLAYPDPSQTPLGPIETPPLLLRDRSATLLGAPLGPPVGVVGDAGYEETTARLRPGDRLLLYTDGLVARRREGLQLHRLLDVAVVAVRITPAGPASG